MKIKWRTPGRSVGIAKITAALMWMALAYCPAMRVEAQATQFADKPPLLVGAAWYPEQWPEDAWDKDLGLMEAAHINLVRVGEFAWSRMEPSEGQFDFSWLDHAIEKAAAHHIVVVLGTPTAAPPAWLTTKYPDTLRVDENGRRDEHGNRAQFTLTGKHYREFAHKIAEQMAMRYGHNPDVVGWQLDNEYGNDSFDDETKALFHAWLKAKYGTVEKLNTLWTTAYWSQTYDTFDEIPARAENENPALLLDWRHFISDEWKSYSQNQIDAIRPHADKRQFITTNTMGWFDGFDEYVVHSNLDIAAWDDYIGGDTYDLSANGAAHDLTRGYKQKNFWVMETEPAFVNWRQTNTPLERGQVREMAWQAVGHGADAVEYWQWRSALNGQEQYHGVLVGADGTPVPVYDEVKQIGDEFAEAGAAISGTVPRAQVALIQSYDSRWAINFQKHSKEFDPVRELIAFYTPLRDQSQAVDVLSPDADLSGYKVVVAPALNVMSQALGDRLRAYVEQGGVLVLGPRSGMKDEYNALHTERQPGPLLDLLGGRVEQFYALDTKVPVSGDAGSGSASIWAEALSAKSPETKVLMRYGKSNGWLDDQPAVLTRKVGKGSITYIGAWLDDALLARITAQVLSQGGVEPFIANVPTGVEVCMRTDSANSGKQKSVLILINHTAQKQQLKLPRSMRDLFAAGTPARTMIELPAHGVDVLAGGVEP